MTPAAPAPAPQVSVRTDRPRVLYVTEDLGGGTGSHLVRLLDHADGGWDARILCFGRRYRVDLPRCPAEFATPSGILGRFPLAQLRALFRLRRAVREFHPHVVHTYFFWPIVYGRILKRLGVIPRLVENREDLGFSWGQLEYRLLRLTRRIPDRVICVADAVRRVVVEREGVDLDRVVTIRNGVEVGGRGGAPHTQYPEPVRDLAGRRGELGLGEDALVVGMVSNLNRPVKGIEYFLQAVPRILGEVPSARFLILGGGRLRDRYERQARALGVADRVVFSGHRQDVARCYEAMDVSVLTSLSEGLSITLLESIGHGLPVVVTDVGGNREVVVDGETGYLVPARDVEAFARRVVELLRDPARRAAMGEAGRRRAEREFALERVAGRYGEVYREVGRGRSRLSR